MLAYYLHDLSPFALELGRSASGQPWGIRWYGISYLLGFIAAYWLLQKLAKEQILRIPPERVPDLVLNCCIWGVVLGGRLGHVIFYDPTLLWDFSASFPFWGVLKIWQGGMSAHGGIIGVILAIILFARRNRFSIVNIGDAACMVVPLGLLFGRIANFINGELYGRITTLPWGVQFPTELIAPTNGERLPPDMADKLANALNIVNDQVAILMDKLGLTGIPITGPHDLVRLLQVPSTVLPRGVPPADLAAIHQTVQAQLALVLPARHPSQLYEAGLEGVLLFLICWTIGRYWRKPGMASGAFLTLYPVMRIIGEQFRVGDEPPAWLAWTHQSQGVLLSLLMIIPGALYWIYWMRRPTPAIILQPDQPPAPPSISPPSTPVNPAGPVTQGSPL